MKTKLLFSLILAAISCTSYAKEEIGTGYGASFKEALQVAKDVVVEQAASTFISSHEEFSNNKYKERIAQYNGGFINHFDVTDTSINDNIYKVTIDADVDVNKVNTVIEGASAGIKDDKIQSMVRGIEDNEKIRDAWKNISEVTKPFAIKIDKSQYISNENGSVGIYYDIFVLWNPKWFDDAIKLANATSYTSKDLETINPSYAICFTKVPCVFSPILPKILMPVERSFTLTINFKDGTQKKLKEIHDVDTKFLTGSYQYVSTGLFSAKNLYTIIFNKTYDKIQISYKISLEDFKNIEDASLDIDY